MSHSNDPFTSYGDNMGYQSSGPGFNNGPSDLDPEEQRRRIMTNPFLSPQFNRNSDPLVDSMADQLFGNFNTTNTGNPVDVARTPAASSPSPQIEKAKALPPRPRSSIDKANISANSYEPLEPLPSYSPPKDPPAHPQRRLQRTHSSNHLSAGSRNSLISRSSTPDLKSPGNGSSTLRRNKTVRETSSTQAKRRSNNPLDQIDRLDVTGLYGAGSFHHDGPFDACRPHRNVNTSKAPVAAFPEDSVANSIQPPGTGFNDPKHKQNFHRMSVAEQLKTKNILQQPLGSDAFEEDFIITPAGSALTDSTRIEGAPASKNAIARNEEMLAIEKANLSRKKSIAKKLGLSRGPSLSRSTTLPLNYRNKSASASWKPYRNEPSRSPLVPISNRDETDNEPVTERTPKPANSSYSNNENYERKRRPPPPRPPQSNLQRKSVLNTTPYPSYTQSETSLPLSSGNGSLKPKRAGFFRRLFSKHRS
ncbi:membrane associated protein Pal1 [Schizosaccharomyces japonicus yFS275]|uniref:Membrane associated protein Pal1 n=1 Tax=Schizosaccharomyces japonicus (strain yFS275 / FY16936) TaxID=402676 RepID=B6K5S4_SCHJY|nr:membrane associated protein Pal1 [Schizosaccharomyces japonicus yFS275]EEB08878.2 membrane associated protein Pal1 [Schizosaccharomyces japonicus yFS275]